MDVKLQHVDFFARTVTRDIVSRAARCTYPSHPADRPREFVQARLSEEFVAAARTFGVALDHVGPLIWTPPFCPRCTRRDLASGVPLRAPRELDLVLELDGSYEQVERLAMADA